MSVLERLLENGIFSKMKKEATSFEKFKSAYEKITGQNIDEKDVSKSIRNAFREKKSLSTIEFAKLPHEEAAAYLEAHRLPPDEAYLRLQNKLREFEEIYGMSSRIFMDKWANRELSEKHDFFVWAGYYKTYLKWQEQVK